MYIQHPFSKWQQRELVLYFVFDQAFFWVDLMSLFGPPSDLVTIHASFPNWHCTWHLIHKIIKVGCKSNDTNTIQAVTKESVFFVFLTLLLMEKCRVIQAKKTCNALNKKESLRIMHTLHRTSASPCTISHTNYPGVEQNTWPTLASRVWVIWNSPFYIPK